MMAVGTTCSNASRPPHWERRDRRRPAIIDRRYSGNDERRFRNPNLRHFQAPLALDVGPRREHRVARKAGE